VLKVDRSRGLDVVAQERRTYSPETATISIEHLLGTEEYSGKKMLELYQKALKEEVNSEGFRDAVFNASTNHVEGKSWEKRPAIIIGGPSGSGKSYAATGVLEALSVVLPRQANDQHTGNDVTTIDGGIVREQSQMRKLMIL
jgi:sigma54-dependent transcription regulator